MTFYLVWKVFYHLLQLSQLLVSSPQDALSRVINNLMSREISLQKRKYLTSNCGTLGFSLDYIEMTNSEILRGLQIISLSSSSYCTILYSNTQREEKNKYCIKITSNTLIQVYCVVFLVKTSLINHCYAECIQINVNSLVRFLYLFQARGQEEYFRPTQANKWK